ncbi:DEAD/DEAH box helicase [Streptococcaceae bacterium ESL0729]|nr:DEAD/DEAH box helicase [Streptococcaceae bacterium ESL0729]
MSRMMPAYIRAEGIELYENHKVTDVNLGDMVLSANVDGELVSYDLDGENDFCSCQVFASKKYCQHIAAIEEYLKQDQKSNSSNQILEIAERTQKFNQELSFGSNFLKEINEIDDDYEDSLSLGVEIFDTASSGHLFHHGDNLALTIKIRAAKASRSYIVKDIPHFLGIIEKNELYQLGKDYLVRLNISNFDENSQNFIRLLIKLLPGEVLVENETYQKNGRFLVIPLSSLEPILEEAYLLDDFKLTIGSRDLTFFSFLDLDSEAGLFTFKVEPQDDNISLKLFRKAFKEFYAGKIINFENYFYLLSIEQAKLLERINKIIDEDVKMNLEPKMIFDYKEKDQLSMALERLETIGQVEANKSFRIHKFKPIFYFDLSTRLDLSIVFDYGDFEVTSLKELEELDFSRDLLMEKKIFTCMTSLGFPRGFKSSQIRPLNDKLYEFFTKVIPEFELLGEVVLSPSLKNLRVEASDDLEISTSGNLLDIKFDFSDIDDSELEKVIKRLRNNEDHYVTDSGKILLFNKKNFKPIREVLSELGDSVATKDGKLTLPVYRTFQIARIFEGVKSVRYSQEFKNLYKDLTHPEEFPFSQPEEIKADLRHYQVDGVKWMKMLTSHHMGGILADDMGLGKTLQSITFLVSSMKDCDKSLIVAPSSLIYNWESEFKKFAPQMNLVVVEGSKKLREQIISDDHQIYVTSYGSFLKDLDAYQERELNFLLMDEAQTVKNAQSKTNKALAQLKVDTVFAISGTPIENRLDEMWALFNIVMPGLFGDKKKFIKTPSESIARIIKPFIMRRKKDEVLKELPEKLEIVHYSELTEEQKVIYLAQLQTMQDKIKSMDKGEFNRNKIEILSGITRLRQICDTPALFMPDYEGSSGKLELLTNLLEQIKENGHRPLIFSQFTKMFDYIEEGMKKVGLSSYKLTGATPAKDRLHMVEAFNAGSRDAFLISLKAGGTGLNLTSADVVILVDLWWNPSVEEQAISRAHRMGQKRTVEVIRLVTRGTIEEKIQEIQSKKQDLITTVLDGGVSNRNITEDEIMEILGLQL